MKRVFLLFLLGIFFLFSGLITNKSDLKEVLSSKITQINSSSLSNSQPKVIKVIDGDTVEVELDNNIERIRLIGIDTPETVDPKKPKQCFGEQASNKTKELLAGKFVVLEEDKSQKDKDKYGRLLRYLFLTDGKNFNLFMIRSGFAKEYTFEEYPYKYQKAFKKAEYDAKNENLGLWGACYNK